MNMECYGCSRQIPDGEPYVSLNYHIERTDEGMVVVDEAESFLTTCRGPA